MRSLKSDGTDVLAEGTTTLMVQAEQQVEAGVILVAGRLPDQDSDGVPDRIDNCPTQPNPDQRPCGGADAGVDGPRHDASDASPADLVSPDAPLKDKGPTPDQPPPTCTCPLGCKPGTLTCRKLIPSNGYTLPAGGYQTVSTVFMNFTLNTTTCQILSSPPFKGVIQGGACVFAVESFEINSGVTVSVQGTLPLVVLANKKVKIMGGLDVGAKGATPGPGGGVGGVPLANGRGVKGSGPGGGFVCGCGSLGTSDDCGGGGGGHGTNGGKGGPDSASCTTVSTGGPVVGVSSLTPLTAGSGGASADQMVSDPANGAGGAGGGALQISCQGGINVSGWISAGGGGGRTGAYTTTNPGGIAGGGGGSGGGILLEGQSIGGSGIVAANGGGGGGSSLSVAGACHGQGSVGQDGAASLAAAQGGAAGASGCGKGGAGGYATTASIDGEGSVNGGGGGGGAAGRVRYNWYQHAATLPLSKTSAVASTGEAKVQ